jgi:hypothetical protein
MTRLTLKSILLPAAAVIIAGCASQPKPEALLTPEMMSAWRIGPHSIEQTPWQLVNGVAYGQGNIIGSPEIYEDFILECDFMYDGRNEGGITIRSSIDSIRPWTVGYELDIDRAPDNVQGHIHYPIKPKPYSGQAVFEPGVWQHVRIEAQGPHVVTYLNERKVIEFTDGEFAKGAICLQGEKYGVRYRNLEITPIDSGIMPW